MNINHSLKFTPRDTRDHSNKAISVRRSNRLKGKTLKHILIDRFLNLYGFEKGEIVATAIISDILNIIERFYLFHDHSFLKEGQFVWLAPPIDEFPQKAKTMAQTKLIPIILDFITTSDLEDMKIPLHHREVRIKKCERWTNQAFDQGALLSNLDLATLLHVNENSAAEYVREYYSLYGIHLPTRGNVQLIGGGQTHKQIIIADYLNGYTTPKICLRTNHSKEAVERYIRDFLAVQLLHSKFDSIETISLVTRLSKRVVQQYIDLIPIDSF